MKKSVDKIYILGNGNQAPYGIGEIIEIVPLSHHRKIAAICGRYYNQPTMRLNSKEGDRMEWDYEGNLKNAGPY